MGPLGSHYLAGAGLTSVPLAVCYGVGCCCDKGWEAGKQDLRGPAEDVQMRGFVAAGLWEAERDVTCPLMRLIGLML